MPTVYRVTSIWQGFAGSPGYTRLSFLDLTTSAALDAAGTATRAFFQSMAGLIPTGTTIQVSPVVDEFDAASGLLTGSDSMTTTPAVVTSTATSSRYAAGSGFVVTWNTDTIFRGHRVRGRTFIVPASGLAFEPDGSLDPLTVTTATTGATALVNAAAELAIWSRHFEIINGQQEQTDGAVVPVRSGTVKDTASQLRSRRT